MKTKKMPPRLAYRYLVAVTALILLFSSGGVAQAYDPFPDENIDKSGRVMLNLRGGPAFGIANVGQDLRYLGMLGIDFGVALSKDFNAYLVLSPQVDLRQDFYNIIVPLGFQYDVRIARGLFLYPRISLGYSAMLSNASLSLGSLRLSATDVTHGGMAIGELGVKYVINGRFNVGLEPLSIPIFFTSDNYAVWYRVTLFLGGNF